MSFVVPFDDVTLETIGALALSRQVSSNAADRAQRGMVLLSLEIIRGLIVKHKEAPIKAAFGKLATKYICARSDLGIKGAGQVPVCLTV